MASHVASADDADAAALRNKAVTEFASVIATLDGVELDASEADALKKMKRGAALRGVMAAKGCDKPETLETMAREWVGGMLVATYALEKAASSRRFVQEGDRDLVRTLNKCYDATSTWAETHLVKALGLAKKKADDDEQRPSCEARPDPVPEAEARRLVNEALRRGTAQFEDYAGDDPAPAAVALQTDTWEALNWRRGALAYYVTATVCGLGKGNPTSNELAKSAVAIKDELEAGVAAIGRVLDARGGDALHSDLKPATQATDYGVWSTTHLLGMAYAGEQAYILWLLDDSEDYRRIALVLLHRYVYVVEVLMVGCGWSVKRPKELLGLLGGRKAVEARLAEAWGADEAIAKELKRLGLGDAPSEKKPSGGRRKKKGR
jgi:hypothetical protein